MWYILTVILLCVALFVGYRMTLMIDGFLKKHRPEED